METNETNSLSAPRLSCESQGIYWEGKIEDIHGKLQFIGRENEGEHRNRAPLREAEREVLPEGGDALSDVMPGFAPGVKAHQWMQPVRNERPGDVSISPADVRYKTAAERCQSDESTIKPPNSFVSKHMIVIKITYFSTIDRNIPQAR